MKTLMLRRSYKHMSLSFQHQTISNYSKIKLGGNPKDKKKKKKKKKRENFYH